MSLRPYQTAAVEAVFRELETHRSTLLVMATGCGKTVVFTDVARRWRAASRGRVLVLAHREELIFQAQDKIQSFGGLAVAIEMAEHRATGLFGGQADVVVATVQSMSARLQSYAPDAFDLIVVDEAHHATAATYRSILGYFPGAKVLGVTATPDRGDGAAMGQVFESVAFQYGIRDAIDEGFLCPIVGQTVRVDPDSIDLSKVRTTDGDLNEADLEEILLQEKALHAIATPLVEKSADRPTLVFALNVDHAHALAEVIARHAGRPAHALDGKTDTDVRRKTLADFQSGQFQFLVNYGLFTEGFDAPLVSCVAIGRPTKSRSLYAQMIGRGTRLHPGKPNLLVLDFEGNSGKHDLIGPADILGGREDEEVVKRAKKIAEEEGLPVHEAIDEARERVADERRKKVIAKARYQATDFDPFQVLGAVTRPTYWAKDNVTAGQIAVLESKIGGKPGSAARRAFEALKKTLTKGSASALIDGIKRRQHDGLCTFSQARTLAKYGLNPDVPFDQARRQLDMLAANNWRVPPGMLEGSDQGHREESAAASEAFATRIRLRDEEVPF